MDTNIQPLKVIQCPYYPISFEDTVKKSTGLFIVVYSEQVDEACNNPQNVLALKITSVKPANSKFVKLTPSTLLTYESSESWFKFKKTSYVLGAHLVSLPISSCEVLGVLPIKESVQILSLITDTFGNILIQSSALLQNLE